MAKDIDIYLDEIQFKRLSLFPDSLGYVMWNIAVILAPKDTGNLQRSITMRTNTNKTKTITYNTMNANYIKFLELGMGNVKKHKGFIENRTRISMVESLIIYAYSGFLPPYTNIPTVELGDTTALFSKEKMILNSVGKSSQNINADVRMRISRLREQSYRQQVGINSFSVRGEKVKTIRSYRYGSNVGNSELSKAYTKSKGG